MGETQAGKFTHINADGQAKMVDVSDRNISVRTATATGKVHLASEVITLLLDGNIPKGDVLATARIAGIMAAKKTPDLIPLAHPIAIHGVEVSVEVVGKVVEIMATVTTADRTGVEMEALTVVSVAGLTVIDMIKSLDPSAFISEIMLQRKDGGRNGLWERV